MGLSRLRPGRSMSQVADVQYQYRYDPCARYVQADAAGVEPADAAGAVPDRLHLRRSVFLRLPARRSGAGACPHSGADEAALSTVFSRRACRCDSAASSITARRSSTRAGSSAWCRRRTCRTTASFTSCGSFLPRRALGRKHLRPDALRPERAVRHGSAFCLRGACRTIPSASSCARTSGSRARRRPGSGRRRGHHCRTCPPRTR